LPRPAWRYAVEFEIWGLVALRFMFSRYEVVVLQTVSRFWKSETPLARTRPGKVRRKSSKCMMDMEATRWYEIYYRRDKVSKMQLMGEGRIERGRNATGRFGEGRK